MTDIANNTGVVANPSTTHAAEIDTPHSAADSAAMQAAGARAAGGPSDGRGSVLGAPSQASTAAPRRSTSLGARGSRTRHSTAHAPPVSDPQAMIFGQPVTPVAPPSPPAISPAARILADAEADVRSRDQLASDEQLRRVVGTAVADATREALDDMRATPRPLPGADLRRWLQDRVVAVLQRSPRLQRVHPTRFLIAGGLIAAALTASTAGAVVHRHRAERLASQDADDARAFETTRAIARTPGEVARAGPAREIGGQYAAGAHAAELALYDAWFAAVTDNAGRLAILSADVEASVAKHDLVRMRELMYRFEQVDGVEQDARADLARAALLEGIGRVVHRTDPMLAARCDRRAKELRSAATMHGHAVLGDAWSPAVAKQLVLGSQAASRTVERSSATQAFHRGFDATITHADATIRLAESLAVRAIAEPTKHIRPESPR